MKPSTKPDNSVGLNNILFTNLPIHQFKSKIWKKEDLDLIESQRFMRTTPATQFISYVDMLVFHNFTQFRKVLCLDLLSKFELLKVG